MFDRSQQFPGECGHGQDPENIGGLAESLYGVNILCPLLSQFPAGRYFDQLF